MTDSDNQLHPAPSCQPKSAIDVARIASTVASIPHGHWTSYGDVARACGGTFAHARTLNGHFMRHQIAGAHRVLRANGQISPTALGDPVAVRRQLEAEGVRFRRRPRVTRDARPSTEQHE